MAVKSTNTQIIKQVYADETKKHIMPGSVDVPLTDGFASRLHETLDVSQLMDDFNDVFRNKVLCDGIEYNDDTTQTYSLYGIKGQHHYIYTLRYDEKILGTISITRDSVFLDHETETIEVMLAGLILPLRNALCFKQSIQLTQRDELTGLRNGSYYHDVAELEVKRAQRYKIPFSLLLFDIDNLDLINRQYGRDAGDAVLIEVAKRLEKKARSSDIVYRNSGDDFIVFLPNTEKDKATEAAERIKEFVLMDKCIYLDNRIEFTLSVSVETVAYEDTASQLMDRASKSLLQVKTHRKNRNHSDLATKQIQMGNL